jgi:glycosyltransferase involved in cell wall biosynthesis
MISESSSSCSLAAPAVSVIIAVKNSARYLKQCLDSVAAQTFDCCEVLVVDGSSTDATEAIARSYAKVSFFQQSGIGFANAWNCGLRRARAEFVAFIDSDDVWTPDKLARQVDLLRNDTNLEAVIGKVRFVLEPGEIPPRGFRPEILGRDHIAQMPGLLLARRRLFEQIGYWLEGWVTANDLDWFFKLKDSGLPVGIVDDVLLYKRVHSRNISLVGAVGAAYRQELLQALHWSIIRKRSASQRTASDKREPVPRANL